MTGARRRAAPALLVMTIVLAACGTSHAAGNGRSSPDRLTGDEIAATDASTMFDVIQQTRPRWLIARSDRPILVYLDTSFLGAPDALYSIDPAHVASAEYLDEVEAGGRLPGLIGRRFQGAIVINSH